MPRVMGKATLREVRGLDAPVPILVGVLDRPRQSRLGQTALAAVVATLAITLLAICQDTRSEGPQVPTPRVTETTDGKDRHRLAPIPDTGLVSPEAQDAGKPPEGRRTDQASDQASDGGLDESVRELFDSNLKRGGVSPPASVHEPVAPSRNEADTRRGTDALVQQPLDEPVGPADEHTGTPRGGGVHGQTNFGGADRLVRELLEAAGLLENETAKTAVVSSAASAHEPIKPIPEETATNPEKVALGRALFHDPRLSKDNTAACVSCHDLGSGGDDGRKVSTGLSGRLGLINAPTVFNVGLNFTQFWDGRAETLEQQIDGPVQSRLELDSLWPDVLTKLYSHESYPQRFNALYPDGITRETVKDALAEFMRSLTTPNSRFDQWLRGNADAIDEQEKYGYALFKHYGCVSCHQGANVGGNMFQVFGVLNEYFEKRGNVTTADLGRFNITGEDEDRHAFKVPSLRMAAHTAPYLHDGSAATLRDAVDAMFEFQLGRTAPDEDKEAIVAFIGTLAGENKELFQ